MHKTAAILIISVFTLSGSFNLEKNISIKQNFKERNNMAIPTDSLPFNLSKDNLASVDIFYAYYSAKTGAGKQEIIITGSGAVTLIYSKSMYDDKPETKTGSIPAEYLVNLLDVFEEENFFGLEDHYPSEGDPHARRLLRLTLPDTSKTIILEESCVPEFERITAALKYAVGTTLPEIFQHRFFPNL